MKVEVWKNYAFFDKNLAINAKDLTSKEMDEVLVKVVKGLEGSNSAFIQKWKKSEKSSNSSHATTSWSVN